MGLHVVDHDWLYRSAAENNNDVSAFAASSSEESLLAFQMLTFSFSSHMPLYFDC